MKKFAVMVGLLLGVLAPSFVAAESSCDRDCLRAHIDGWLAAMLAHDPGKLKLASGFRFTEDARELALSDSTLWKSATAVRPFRQDYLDVPGNTAAAHVLVEEGGNPVMLALRLRIIDGRISEAETLTVRSAQEGMFFEPDTLKAPSDVMNTAPEPMHQNSRTQLVMIAERYPRGLKIGSFVKAETPIAPEAYRLENGRRMAGPGCTFQPPTCENMLAQRIPTLPGIAWRVIAVDEDMGLILLRLDFGKGSIPGPGERTLHAWEAFKIDTGQIHAAEAFMRAMPAGTPSGW